MFGLFGYYQAEEDEMPPCNHAFHQRCINEWLKKNRRCPICRNLTLGDSSSPNALVPLVSPTDLSREELDLMKDTPIRHILIKKLFALNKKTGAIYPVKHRCPFYVEASVIVLSSGERRIIPQVSSCHPIRSLLCTNDTYFFYKLF
ncbi:hypothetical protein CEXT_110641 [Caerostris extrusa]|uniref:RING-type domain-containing protein n=1 Tax=Caerostris extrusa TaxID=172846 RepID=A0AAV4MPR4_CAEEX|nr:hypothetical protein CEXT_110641 [Caerostris extrusa]